MAKRVRVLGADPPPVSGRRNGGLAGDDGARLPTGLPRGREGAPPPPPPTRDPSLRIAPLRSCRVNIAKLYFFLDCRDRYSYHQLNFKIVHLVVLLDSVVTVAERRICMLRICLSTRRCSTDYVARPAGTLLLH